MSISDYFTVVNLLTGIYYYSIRGDHMGMYERVSKLAAKNKITIAELERELGYSSASLRKMKTNSPSADKVLAIAQYFGVSTDYLYGKTPIEKPADQLMDVDFVSLQRARQNMSSEEWDQAMNIIRAGFAFAFED